MKTGNANSQGNEEVISRYDYHKKYTDCGNVNVDLEWTTKHDDKNGYIYVTYRYAIPCTFGGKKHTTYGSTRAVWTIEKRNDKWEIVEIFDDSVLGEWLTKYEYKFKHCPDLKDFNKPLEVSN